MVFTKFYSLIHILLVLFWSGFALVAQNQTSIEALANSLNQALIDRNEIQLEQLLHPDLSYGHSNGWVENKEELIHNNQSKYLIYEKISMDSLTVKYSDNISVLRFQSIIDAVLNGKSLSLKLYVCQIWVKLKGKWKLLARQSTKLA